MNVTSSLFIRRACLLASLAFALTGGHTRGAEKSAETDAFPRFESYLKITGQGAAVSGNESSYARRLQMPRAGAYGIEALHFYKDTGKDTAVEFDGRALTGAEDYLGKFLLTKNEVGSFEMGYKRFRTFYDGIGAFFPLNSSWQTLKDSELHTDRAKFWANLKVARPNQPSFELSYANELRSGQKDTTIWGDSDFTGIPVYSNGASNPLYPGYAAARKTMPAYIDLNERQQTLTGLLKHTVGNTEFEFEIVNTRTNSLDTRWMNRYPGELKPYPAIPANPPTVIAPGLVNNLTAGYDKQKSDAKVWGYTGKFETKISDMVAVFGGLAYQDAKADIGGDRQISLTIRTTPGIISSVGGFTANGRPPYSYTTVSGNTKETVTTGNLGFAFKPNKEFHVTLALKGENLDMTGSNSVTYINNLIVQSTGAITPVNFAAPNVSKRSERTWIPELTARYSGIRDLALYGNIDYRSSPGSEFGSSTGVTTGGGTVIPSVVSSDDNTKLNHGHYKAGAAWTVSPMVTLRGEVFY